MGVVSDPIVSLLLPVTVRLQQYTAMPRFVMSGVVDPTGCYGWIVSRTRRIDSHVIRALEDKSAVSLVILGAGFDTRAYRLEIRAEVKVFELDSAATQLAKRKLLASANVNTSHVNFIPINCNKENFLDKLEAKGFDLSKPSVILMEGLLPYMEEKAVRETLTAVRNRCSAGTTLIVTMENSVSPDERDSVFGAAVLYNTITIGGEPITFGLPLGQEKRYVQDLGFKVLSHSTARDLEVDYFLTRGDLQTRVFGAGNVMALRVP
eukprot:CAMPEP_0184488362 /NCGR_PEP_ID=MMETSP0113_2-20130426/11586_1 /TAXON_ID=91329 /ORGANISM="Norrisiella sphaerica, Strain BC52" /LENGTH=263 /DNA_ID=CAMNT_0026871059 /DNA_START=441 /DNA_END=1232 /DNA_ORIENTATION=+